MEAFTRVPVLRRGRVQFRTARWCANGMAAANHSSMGPYRGRRRSQRGGLGGGDWDVFMLATSCF